MDRKQLVDLFQKGMEYPLGRHSFWIARCFKIHVRPDQVVELDEYESFSAKGKPDSTRMFHVGRSVLHLKGGEVMEERGKGWDQKSKKSP